MTRFLISILTEKHAKLKAIAKSEGISLTELIRRILDDWLKKEER